jgi:hypothetical protein
MARQVREAAGPVRTRTLSRLFHVPTRHGRVEYPA